MGFASNMKMFTYRQALQGIKNGLQLSKDDVELLVPLLEKVRRNVTRRKTR